MADTCNPSSLLSLGLRQARGSNNVWQTTVASQPVRHPSRPKHRYRPRGSNHASTHEPRLHQSATDHSATWVAQSSRAQSSRKQRSIAKLGATCLGFGIALGGLSITQAYLTEPRVGPDVAPFQQAPEIGTIAFGEISEMVRPANIGGAPAISALPPELPMMSNRQSSQATTSPHASPSPPDLVSAAPASVQGAITSDRPALKITSSSVPDTTPPTRMALPAPDDPFVCAACEIAIPAFDGVKFAVQATDISTVTAQRLIAALSIYDVDLRASPIAFPRSEVRFYRAQDAEPARILAGQYDANLVDLTWAASPAGAATIEIILAGTAD